MTHEVMFHIPLDTATTPVDGKVICNRWWAIHPEKGLAFYAVVRGHHATEEASPQCHDNEASARRLYGGLYPDHIVAQVPLVFLRHAHREMLRLRKEAREKADDQA